MIRSGRIRTDTIQCLFQGFFFCRPTSVKGATPPAERLTYLRLLAAINQPNVTLFELEELIKQDASLCYRVLRCINSAAFGLQMEIHSIRQALVLLGVAQVRKWASVGCSGARRRAATRKSCRRVPALLVLDRRAALTAALHRDE